MSLPATTGTKRNRLLLALFATVFVICSLPLVTLAQDPIRIETNEVLVPATVYDKDRLGRLLRDPTSFWQAYFTGEMQLVDRIMDGVVIRDLTAIDFRVLEDGKEQPIRSVTYGPSFYWNVRDNKGHHTEYFGSGGGKWSTAEWPSNMVGELEPPHYVIAYAVPESPEGSCHQIKVSVNRHNVMVLARTEYCNSKHSASDPLNGTNLGERLENDLVKPGISTVDVSLLAIALYTNSETARVHIALDWPWKSLNRKPGTKGVLGMVFKRDGSLVTRFSDVDREGVSEHKRRESPVSQSFSSASGTEDRYETQLSLPPGEYDLRAVISDGSKFGRGEFPLTVESYDRKELAISAISLCQQIEDVSAYSPQHRPELPGDWTTKLPGNYVPLVSKDIEFKPTGNTRFKKDDTLYTYFEAYEPLLGAEPRATVEIRLRIVDLKTGELKSDSQPVSATPYVKAGSPVIPIGRGIDISKLPKGSYRLDVQATDSVGKNTPWRSANFTIE